MRRSHWLCLVALVAPLCFGLIAASTAIADPPAAPDQATTIPTLRPDEAGTKTTNIQTGAASYSYPFTLPPARGVGPTLALHYSSSGPISGTIAHGWTFGLPEIKRNVRLEAAGTVTDPAIANTTGKVYEGSIGSQTHQLVKVSDPATTSGAQPYRAKYDTSFVRYEKTPTTWVAYTSDGKTFHFETSLGEWWVLTRVVDRFGNTVTYGWQPVEWQNDASGVGTRPSDLILVSIEYSSNTTAVPNLASHARVDLRWTRSNATCESSGLTLPIGAAVDYSSGNRRVLGTQRLDAIEASIRDRPDGPWTRIHQWTFDYTSLSTNCEATVSPRRQLWHIRETGFTSAGDGTAGPTVTFTYGDVPDHSRLQLTTLTLPTTTMVASAPYSNIFEYPHPTDHNLMQYAVAPEERLIPSIASLMMDIDGDGRPDLVRSNGSPGGCEATYYRNLGNGSFGPGRSFTLPAPVGMPDFRQWPVCQQNNGQPTANCVARVGTTGFAHPEAECSLAGAWWANFSGSARPTFFEGYVYKWIDVDGDNRVDLVVQYYTTDCQSKMIYPNYDRTHCTPSDPDALTWRWYRNITDDSGTRFEFQSPEWTTGVGIAGVPRDGYVSEQSQHVLFDYVDINGDHWPDIITQDYTLPFYSKTIDDEGHNTHTKTWCVPDGARRRFSIKYGTPTGPRTAGTLLMDGIQSGETCLDGSFPLWGGQFVDTNADGLADFLWETIASPGGTRSAQLWLYANTGRNTFDLDAVGLVRPFTLLSYAAPPPPPGLRDTTYSTQQSYPNFPRDLDGDGLIDFPCFNTAPRAACEAAIGEGIAFGNGGGFFRASQAADRSLEPHPFSDNERIGFTSRVFNGNRDDSHGMLVRDFLDLDGDGVPERYRFIENQPQSKLGHYERSIWARPPDVAPGLLVRIDNGRGGTITFQYARSTQSNVLVTPLGQMPDYVSAGDPWITTDWIRPTMTWPLWVVASTIVDDGQGHPSQTSFFYQDPVFISDSPSHDGPGRRFRGFQAVTTVLPAIPGEIASPRLLSRYTYSRHPDGLEDYRARFEYSRETDTFQKRTIDRTTYVARTALGVPCWVLQSSTHIECAPAGGDCDSQTTGYIDRDYTFTALTVGNQTARWDLASTAESTVSSLGTRITRDKDIHYLTSYGAGKYLVLPKRTVETRLSQEIGRQEMFYDDATSVDACGVASCKGALTKKRVYWVLGQSQTAATCPTVGDPDNNRVQIPQCVDYGFIYDAYGNVTRAVAPLAMRAAQGQPGAATAFTSISYDDPSRLFPVTLTSQCPSCAMPSQQVTQVFDRATGLLQATQGPNQRLVGSDWVYEQRSFAYDGLGRLLSETHAQADQAAGYIQRTTHRVRYDPFPANRVAETFYNNWEGTRCTATRKYFDGLGRLSAEQKWLPELAQLGACPATATSPAWPAVTDDFNGVEVHRYDYDARSNLAQVRGPNPQTDASSALVAFAFRYDGRNRLIAATTPDGATTTTSYPPFEKVSIDADGAVNHQYADGFGTLWRVDESGPDGAAAQTLYGYDRYGLLATVQVQDTDNAWHTTTLINDPAGHRTRVTRPGATASWNYQYDAHGRLASKTDPDGRATHYLYDELDRVTDEIVDDPSMPADQALALGIGRLHYIYDGATPEDVAGEPLWNRVGRLSGVEMSAAGQSVPYAAVRYGYDTQGHESFAAWQLHVRPAQYAPGINTTVRASRSFDAQGRIVSATYSADTPQLPPTTVTWAYGSRGLLEEIRGNGLSLARYSYSAAAQPTSRSTSNPSLKYPDQVHRYDYDVRGRLSSDRLTVGSLSLDRFYHYSNSGDVRSIDMKDRLGDRAPLSGPMTVVTDGLHRVVSATINSSDLPYAATLSYWPSGSIKTAGVQLPSGAQQPSRPAGTTYAYGNGRTADVQAVTVLTSGTAPLGSFVYDAAGNLTHRDLGGLLSGSVTDFLYDPNGQLRRATALASFKRFAVVPLLGGTLIPLPVQEQYYYDHTRRRFLTVSNTAPHPWYRFYLGDEFEVDVSSSDAFVRSDVYVAGLGEPIARLHACSCPDGVSCLFCGALTPSWLLHHDRRGDLLAATRLDGTLESHVIYGAFGEVLYKYQRETPDDYTAAADWNRLFNGKEADQATGLSYYGYRFYDPITFQWTTGDPLYRFAPEIGLAQPQNANLHAFTLNNPLRYVDRFGLLEESPPFNPMTCLVCETYVITATSLDTPAVQLADPEMPALYEKTYGYLSSPGFLEFHELYQRVGEVALERNLAVGKVRTMAPYIVGSQGLVWEAFKQSAIGALGGYVLGRVLGFAAEGLLPEAETAGAAGGGGGPYRVPPALPPPPPPPPPPEAVRALIRLLESGPTEAAKQWMFKRLLYPVPGPASP